MATEVIKINPLGETMREQWENTVRIYCHCIRANVDDNPDKAVENVNSLESEVIRFMEYTFDILEKEE